MSKQPLNEFPFTSFPTVIDKLEYLGRNEEQTPYEISPGIDLCLSDTYYSLGFLTYLHAFGRIIEEEGKWMLKPIGKPLPEKPYRFALIDNATLLLEALTRGSKTVDELCEEIPEIPKDQIINYLKILTIITHKGKIIQKSLGWDASFVLSNW